ncbi:peroxidase family protein [Nostoc sp. PCC 7107]|uniref:peroxidase family protein n=1 Tax=Nostoc sp. PCC 7107 TaxID=317936 RepID=UPI00029EE185|nr:peroxidase family protein [Nostoc sp. PCC 7107]AFY42912.1 Prostaglandin-endoperoxide synthase [Nostoc sp. PCC 7107]
MAGKRDTSRDGLNNKIQTLVLTNFKGLWQLIQSNESLKRKVNKALLNSLIYKIPTRPNPYSTMTLDEHIPDTDKKKKTDTYTSWDSLNDRTYTGRHLPPNPKLNAEGNLPKVEDLAILFRKRDGKTIYSSKSTMLFPYWVQWFTDSFLRLDHTNKLKNTSNHEIDLCNVYGLTRKQTHLLRSFQGGKFKTQKLKRQDGVEEEYPLFYYADPAQGIVDPQFAGLYEPVNDEKRQPADKKQYLFAMGVERANVQIGYVMLNTLCLREHNRLCDVLASNYPDWDDERLFQTSRNILMAIILKIIMEEYINHITPYHFKLFADPEAFTKESWYRTNHMAIEFDFVYRWHSAIPETFNCNGKPTHVADTLWNNKILIDQGLGALMEETCSQAGTRIGLFNTPNILVDLAELPSIKLGRQLQLASYNDYRELCGFPRVTSFDQITGDEFTQQKLKEFYGHVDNIEFFVGLYSEDVRQNSTIPPLVARLIGIDAFSQALTNPLLSPKIFNKDTLSPIGWEIYQTTNTVSDLVNRNVPASDKKYKVTFELHKE